MHQQADNAQFSIDEVTGLTGFPRRTVRYYIQKGLVDRPEGETRAAYYTRSHLEQLLAIRRWQEAGLSLDRIGELLRGEGDEPPPKRPQPGSVAVVSHIHLADGITLQVEPETANLAPAQLRELARRATDLLEAIRKEDRK